MLSYQKWYLVFSYVKSRRNSILSFLKSKCSGQKWHTRHFLPPEWNTGNLLQFFCLFVFRQEQNVAVLNSSYVPCAYDPSFFIHEWWMRVFKRKCFLSLPTVVALQGPCEFAGILMRPLPCLAEMLQLKEHYSLPIYSDLFTIWFPWLQNEEESQVGGSKWVEWITGCIL